MAIAAPLTADQLNKIAQGSGYQGTPFTSVGLPTTPQTTLTNTATPAPTGTTLAQDQAKATNQGKAGYDVLGNPTVTTPTTSTGTTSTPTDPNQTKINDAEVARAANEAELQRVGKLAIDTMTGLQNGTTPLNAGEQAQVDALKQIYQKYIDDQKLTNIGASGTANIRGYQQGAAEYDPTFQAKTIGAIVDAGAAKVKAYEVEMAGKISALTMAMRNNDIANVKGIWDSYQSLADRKSKDLQKTIDDTHAAIKEANAAKIAADKVIYDQKEKEQKDLYDRVTKPIEDLALSAQKNGATSQQILAIKNSKTVDEAIVSAGDSLQTATGKPGEYLFVKQQYARQGLVPPTYDEWTKAEQKRELNNKYSEAYASAKGTAQAKAEVDAAQERLVNDGVNSHAGPYAPALAVVLGSGKFTEIQKKDLKNAVNAGEDPGVVLKNQAKNIMEGTSKTQLTNYESIVESTKNLQSALDAFYAAGGKTGVLKGNLEKVTNKFGEVNDPALVDLAVQIQVQLQKYRNSISGTAYSDQEGKDIASIFPGINKGEILNNTVVKARLKATEAVIDSFYKPVLGDNAYSKLKEADKQMQNSGIDEHKQDDATVVSGLNKIKTTNPKIFQAASGMYTSNNPETGQPYSPADILLAFPELTQ